VNLGWTTAGAVTGPLAGAGLAVLAAGLLAPPSRSCGPVPVGGPVAMMPTAGPGAGS